MRNKVIKEKTENKRKMPPCLTCLITCLVIVVVLTVGVIVAANVVFNKTVSPMIGGVKLNECFKLLNGALRSNRKKIVTDEYGSSDLNDFYFSLNSMLYQKEMTDAEYQERYDALSDEEKAEYGSLEAYKEAHPYRIDLDAISSAMNLDELLNGSSSDTGSDENGDVSAAEDDVSDGSDGSETNDSFAELFKRLAFDFSSLKEYPYESEYEDYKYTSFQITGKQIAAVVNELISVIFKAVNIGEKVPQLEGVDLTAYAGVPQIIAKEEKYTDSDGAENTRAKLSITVEIKIKDLVKDAVAPMLEEQNVPKFVINIIKNILPKDFFVSLETYPTDANGEVTVKINNYDDKTANNLKKIVNALTKDKDINLFGSDSSSTENGDSTPDDNTQNEEPKNVFNQINAKVVDVFGKINEVVPVQFVSDEAGSMTLRISHIQALLKTMGLFDENDVENSVTPHMFLTTLRCIIEGSTVESNEEELDSLYLQMEEKYGIDKTYWDDHDLLDKETLNNISSEINMTNVTFEDNADMRVFIREGQLTKLLSSAIESGLFDKKNEEVSAASDTENGGSENSILDKFTFSSVTIESISKQKINGYTYESDVDGINYLSSGEKVYYKLGATLSVDFAELISSTNGNSENEDTDSSKNQSSDALLDSLKSALPEKLSISLIINILEIYDEEGNLFHRVIGAEVDKTSFKFNKFNEYYSERVMTVIQLIVKKTTTDSSQPNLDDFTDTIEKSFINVFDSIKDSLYCDVMLSDTDGNKESVGCLVLPSVYELVRGSAVKQVEEDSELSESDLLSISEIKDLFVQVYNTEIYVSDDGTLPPDASKYDKIITKYDSEAGNDFLDELSRKYYMKNKLTSEKLFGDSGFDLSADAFDFNGSAGLYHDSTAMSELDVSISSEALASVIDDSGKLSSVTTGENDFLESLKIIACAYVWNNETLYVDFEFEATIKVTTSSSSNINIGSLLPEKAYITARIELYDSQNEENLYDTDILLNDSDITNLTKLVKIFAKNSFDTNTITDQVKDTVKDAFDKVKENINFKYSIGNSQSAITFKNVFNTLNKFSHADSDDPIKHAEHVAYESLSEEEKNLDDLALRSLLKEFGRAPEYTANTTVDGSREYLIVNSAEITYFDSRADAIYSVSDADDFFDDLNANYYVSDDKLLSYESLKNMTSVSSDLISFKKLYEDNRSIGEMSVNLTSNRFTALANQIVGEIDIDGNSNSSSSTTTDDKIAKATIVQTRINSDGSSNTLDIVVFVRITATDELLSNLLPSHLFITATVDLSTKNESGEKTYETKVFINNFDEEKTDDLFDRIKRLESSLNTDLGFDADTLKNTLQTQVKDVFENNMNMFGELNIKDGYIDLPNLFEYVTGGTISSDGNYDENKPLFETCDLSSTKGTYGIDDDGNAGYFDNANFIVLGVAKKNADGIWGYDGESDFVAIQTLPEQVMYNLRSFGKKPEETTDEITENDYLGYDILNYDNLNKEVRKKSDKVIKVYENIDIYLQNPEDGFYFKKGDYYFDEQSYFFDMINTNYYITNPEKKITADTINSNQAFVLDNELFDFDKLYNDQRSFEDMSINVKGNLFAALAEKFYEGGIKISDNDTAKIVQMHIFTKDIVENNDNLLGEETKYNTLRTVIRVELSQESNSLGVLPEYLYMICYTIIDTEAGENRFDTEFIINDFGYDYVTSYAGIKGQISETEKFIDRLNVIKDSFGLTYDFDLNDIKNKIKDTFRDIFEKNLSTFGDLKYENDSIVVPNIFQYMTEGQLIREEGSTNLNYHVGEEYVMKEADGITETDPEKLRERFIELGTGEKYDGNSIPVWYSAGKYYNDNIYSQDDLDKFYTDVQAFYFLKNKPTKDDFTGGGSYFDDLDGANFESVFNLKGLSDTTVTGVRGEYIKKGLYNYAGEQLTLKLSDKAMAGLINEQNSIVAEEEMKVESLTVTSIKLGYIDENHMTIEITLKVNTNSKGSMPKVFYLTTITDRNTESGSPVYTTKIAVNAFTPEELENFLANVRHVEVASNAGLIENLTTDKIAPVVEDALAEMLDGKLANYTEGFGKYDDVDDGVGFVEFPNIYSKILKTTGATKGNEKDMQNVIVKLNNANATLYKNKYSSSDAPVLMQSYMTDKQFGFGLNALLKADSSNDYITVEQAIIFKGVAEEYGDFENLVKNIDSSFAFKSDDSGYYLVTVSINSSNLTCSMSIAPEKIYISLIIDADGNLIKYVNESGVTTSIKIIQDFTESEQNLFLSIFTDGDDKMNVDSTIETKAKSVMNYVSDRTLNQNDDFNDYYGFVGTK